MTATSLRSNLLIHGSAVLAAAFVAILLLAPSMVGKGISDAAVACGGTRNMVFTEFDLGRASDIWREFPAMLRAPELETTEGPVHVVVFKGSVDISGMVGGRSANIPTVSDALCVVAADGEVFFYDGVSRAGSRYAE